VQQARGGLPTLRHALKVLDEPPQVRQEGVDGGKRAPQGRPLKQLAPLLQLLRVAGPERESWVWVLAADRGACCQRYG
jgi:hypothetical protein